MKKINLKRKITNYLSINKTPLVFSCLSIFVGVIIGSFVAAFMCGNDFDSLNSYLKNFISAYNLQTIDSWDIFRTSLYNGIKTVLIMWISGVWVYFLPLSYIQLLSKGYKIGLTIAIFVRVFGGFGVLFSVVSLLVQILFLVPIMIFYCVFNTRFSIRLHKLRGQRVSSDLRNEICFKNLVYLFIIIVLTLIYCLAEAFIMPPILKLVCSFFI